MVWGGAVAVVNAKFRMQNSECKNRVPVDRVSFFEFLILNFAFFPTLPPGGPPKRESESPHR